MKCAEHPMLRERLNSFSYFYLHTRKTLFRCFSTFVDMLNSLVCFSVAILALASRRARCALQEQNFIIARRSSCEEGGTDWSESINGAKTHPLQKFVNKILVSRKPACCNIDAGLGGEGKLWHSVLNWFDKVCRFVGNPEKNKYLTWFPKKKPAWWNEWEKTLLSFFFSPRFSSKIYWDIKKLKSFPFPARLIVGRWKSRVNFNLLTRKFFLSWA